VRNLNQSKKTKYLIYSLLITIEIGKPLSHQFVVLVMDFYICGWQFGIFW